MKNGSLERANAAFEYYLGLGNGRTLEKVAENFKINTTTVRKWSARHNWQNRLVQREIEINKQVERDTNVAIADVKAKYRADIQAAMAPLRRELQKILNNYNSLEWIKSFYDFERLLRCMERLTKLDLLLLGESTERGEHEINANKTFIDWLIDERRNDK